jgi:protein involved in polysaccharide export with SLBB domain
MGFGWGARLGARLVWGGGVVLVLAAANAAAQTYGQNQPYPYGYQQRQYDQQQQNPYGQSNQQFPKPQYPAPDMENDAGNNSVQGSLGLRNFEFNSGAEGLDPSAVGRGPSDREQPWVRRHPGGVPGAYTSEFLEPYGSQIFRQPNLVDRKLGTSPDYRISPGDQVAVKTWGAWNSENVLTVDLQGNIFLPQIGPVRVAGLRSSELADKVRNAVRGIFVENVQIYTNLVGVQPISVFVTGSVAVPGQYPGQPEDSLIYYLTRAGSIDPQRGSYRDIRIKRDGQTIADVDLYRFLINGELPPIRFKNGDTIVVGIRHSTVAVEGAVTNDYSYEVASGQTTGADLLPLVAPLSQASHVMLRGIRDGSAFSTYVPIAKIENMLLFDGDSLTFEADRVNREIVVKVTGNSAGPSRFSVPRSTRLGDLLRLVEVDPQVSALDSIFLRRESVAEQQRQAIERSLYELQRSVLTGESTSSTESQIRTQEAQLIERFVNRVRGVKPEGRVVLSGSEIEDVPLEEGDEVVIPERTNLVLVSGEVQVPQTVVWHPDWSVDRYIDAAGGLSSRGDSGNVLVIHVDGSVDQDPKTIAKGDHLMIMPRASTKNFALFKDIIEVVYRVALSAAVAISATN